MNKTIKEALCILEGLGVPLNDLTDRRKERMAKTFMSVAGLRPGMGWSEIKDNDAGH